MLLKQNKDGPRRGFILVCSQSLVSHRYQSKVVCETSGKIDIAGEIKPQISCGI